MSTPQVTHIEAALSDDQIKTILDVMPRIESNKGGLTGGAVAGLVAITPAAGAVGVMGAIAIGFGAGFICFFAG